MVKLICASNNGYSVKGLSETKGYPNFPNLSDSSKKFLSNSELHIDWSAIFQDMQLKIATLKWLFFIQ